MLAFSPYRNMNCVTPSPLQFTAAAPSTITLRDARRNMAISSISATDFQGPAKGCVYVCCSPPGKMFFKADC